MVKDSEKQRRGGQQAGARLLAQTDPVDAERPKVTAALESLLTDFDGTRISIGISCASPIPCLGQQG